MNLGTMAAVMLIIALFTGLMPETLESLRIRRFHLFAILILLPLLRAAGVELSPEVSFNIGSIVLTLLLIFAAVRDGRKTVAAASLAMLLGIPAFMLTEVFTGDAAVLSAALLPLAGLVLRPLRRSPRLLFLLAACMPAAAALFRLIYGLIGGYGVFELGGTEFDIQLTGILFSAFAVELRRYNSGAHEGRNAPDTVLPSRH